MEVGNLSGEPTPDPTDRDGMMTIALERLAAPRRKRDADSCGRGDRGGATARGRSRAWASQNATQAQNATEAATGAEEDDLLLAAQAPSVVSLVGYTALLGIVKVAEGILRLRMRLDREPR